MKLDLTGIHIEITEGLTEFVERKVNRLGKFFKEDTIIHVTISANKVKQNLNIRIESNSHTYIADVETDDLYNNAMDEATEIIIGQILKQKDKKEKQRYEGMPSTPETDVDIEEILNNDEE